MTGPSSYRDTVQGSYHVLNLFRRGKGHTFSKIAIYGDKQRMLFVYSSNAYFVSLDSFKLKVGLFAHLISSWFSGERSSFTEVPSISGHGLPFFVVQQEGKTMCMTWSPKPNLGLR